MHHRPLPLVPSVSRSRRSAVVAAVAAVLFAALAAGQAAPAETASPAPEAAAPPPAAGPAARGRALGPARAAARERIGERLFDGPVPDLGEVLAVLDAADPALAARVREAPASPPRLRLSLLRDRLPELVELVRLRRADEEGFLLRARDITLERESQELARQVAATAPEDAERLARLRADLEARVREHFALRRTLRERELELLAARLAALREELERRDQAEDELVRERLTELETAAGTPGW